ncbi:MULTISPECIES: hypothetical protein [Pseudescherichia]|jgi:hypothetical protein|uniref:hypothetical protein n=1 Tax=Pseudescherichia TaxID=2055880 RepID=UPI001EDF95E5|nr:MULTISPECIES: hypothetical protein [Pseudescherichia]MCR4456995.1 hypothetical protein [Pseudescherichia sp. L3]
MNNEDLHYMDMLKLQYERIAHHENQRLTFSSLVLTITAAMFTFFLSESNDISQGVSDFLLGFLILINLFAAIFIIKSRQWVKFHQERARFLLKKYNEALFNSVYNDADTKSKNTIEEDVLPHPPLKKSSKFDFLKRPGLQSYLHVSIIIIFTIISLIK